MVEQEQENSKKKSAFRHTISFGNLESVRTTSGGSISPSDDDSSSDQNTINYEYDGIIDKSDFFDLPIGSVIKLSGYEFEVKQIISGSSSDSQGIIYRIEDSDKNQYALKIYFNFKHPSDEPRPNVLKCIKRLENKRILKLHDYGTGIKKIRYKYYYEISDLPGGKCLAELDELNLEVLNKTIIPGILEIFKTFRESGIIFLGIRPSNIFFTDESKSSIEVLGYANSHLADSDLNEQISQTLAPGGSDYFSPPEQHERNFKPNSEYFALGMMLLHFLYPNETISSNYAELKKKQTNGVPLVDFDLEMGKINNLIAGLTLENPNLRWGEEEVTDWLSGKLIITHYSKSKIIPVLRLRNKTIERLEQFIDFLRNDKDWYQLLLIDKDEYSKFLKWIQEVQGIRKKEELDSTIKFYTNSSREIIKLSILHCFLPELPVKIGDREFNFFKAIDLEEVVSDFFMKLDSIWKTTGIQILQNYLFHFESALLLINSFRRHTLSAMAGSILAKFRQVLLANDSIQQESNRAQLFKMVNDLNLLKLFYAFNANRSFQTQEGVQLSVNAEIALYFASTPDAFSERLNRIELDYFLSSHDLGHLGGLGLREFTFNLIPDEIVFFIDIVKIEFTTGTNFTVHYTLSRSLTEFMYKNEKPIDLYEEDGVAWKYESKRKLNYSIDELINSFLKYCSKTNKFDLSNLSEKNREKISKIFNDSFKNVAKPVSVIFNSAIPSLIISLIFYLAGNSFIPKYLVIPQNSSAISILSAILWFLFFLSSISGLVFLKKKITKIAGIILLSSLLFLVIEYLDINNLINDSKKIISFRRSSYVDNFYTQLDEDQVMEVNHDAIFSYLNRQFFKGEARFDAKAKFYLSDNGVVFQGSMPVIKRTITENKDGFGNSFEFILEDPNRTKSLVQGKGQVYQLSILLGETEKYFKSGYYPMRIQFEADGDFTGEANRIGISFNRFFLMFSNNGVELMVKEYPESPKQFKEYVLICSELEQSATESQKSNSFDVKPFGASFPVLPIVQNYFKTFQADSLKKLKFDINILREKIFIIINNKIKVSFELDENFWKVQHEGFATSTGIVFEPYTNATISNIRFSELKEVSYGGNKGYKYAPLYVNIKKGTSILNAPNGAEKIRITEGNSEKAEVCYEDRGYYKVILTKSRLAGYVIKDDSIPLYWEGGKK